MKKIISMLTLAATVVTMCSFSVFADYASTLTMSTNVTENKAVAGDEFVVTVKVGTTQGMKGLGFKVVYDPNDFELGMSQDAKDIFADYTPDLGYASFDEFCINEGAGCASYVDTEYFNEYSGLKTAAKLGDPVIDYENKNGKIYVAYGYAKGTTISATNAQTDFPMGGLVLKVKTAEKKAATITIEEASAIGTDGVDTPSTIANTITLNLNGYGEEPEEEKIEASKDADTGVITVTYPEEETGALDGKKIVIWEQNIEQSAITAKTRVKVTAAGKTQTFGGTIYEELGLEGAGSLEGKTVAFGVVYTGDLVATDFAFEIE